MGGLSCDAFMQLRTGGNSSCQAFRQLARLSACSSPLARDGREVHALTQGKPYIYLWYTKSVTEYDVDVNTKDHNAIVFTDDFINCLQRNNGVYVPYVPEKMRGMRSAQETPDVETLVVDHDSFPFFRVSPYTSVESPSDRGTVYVVHLQRGRASLTARLAIRKTKH